jgi:hypothetical protein
MGSGGLDGPLFQWPGTAAFASPSAATCAHAGSPADGPVEGSAAGPRAQGVTAPIPQTFETAAPLRELPRGPLVGCGSGSPPPSCARRESRRPRCRSSVRQMHRDPRGGLAGFFCTLPPYPVLSAPVWGEWALGSSLASWVSRLSWRVSCSQPLGSESRTTRCQAEYTCGSSGRAQ